MRWSVDGTALATCGEDGAIKIWSKNGLQRSSSLAQVDRAIYSIAWSPDGDAILYTCSGELRIQPVQPVCTVPMDSTNVLACKRNEMEGS